MTISEKVAYLKGLAEGLNLDTEKSKEGKLISVMIGILEEVGLSLEDLEENVTALGEELDAVSDDLADVETVLYDDNFFEIQCPECGADIEVDEDVLAKGVVRCPACGGQFAVDLTDDNHSDFPIQDTAVKPEETRSDSETPEQS